MKKRNRRVFCLVFACLMALQLLPQPAAAAPSVYFTAANDRVLELSADSMPFLSNDIYYISNTIFSFSSAGLGIYYSRNKLAQTVTLYTGGDSLVFSLIDGSAVDSRGNTYSYKLMVKGDYVFFPLTMLTEYFGLTYSLISTNYAPVLRVKSGSAALSDWAFLDAASTMLQSRYAQYQKSQAGNTGSDTPALPQDGNQNAKYRLCPVYTVTSQDACAVLLDELDSYHWQGLFLFDPFTLSDYADLLRRMTASGQSIGFLAETMTEDELTAANRQLSLLTGGKTRVLYLAGAAEADRQRLTEAGYCLLSPDGDYTQTDLHVSANATLLIRSYRSANATSLLLFGADTAAAGSCAYLYGRLSSNLYRCAAWRETY